MNESMANDLRNVKIGIIGCGHLGQAIMESLINHQFSKNNIFISYKGNPATYEKLDKLGVAECISENNRILCESNIIFVTTRPQDIIHLKTMTLSKETQIISCAAGLSTQLLKKIFRKNVFRMMISGPDTIISEKGVAALYPYNKLAGSLLHQLRLKLFDMSQEDDLDVFTAAVCLPAALLQVNNKREIDDAIAEFAPNYPWLSDLYTWSKEALPSFTSENEKKGYLGKMITAGGVTETLTSSLKSGEPFIEALKKGINRSREITFEISHLIH